MGCDARAWSVLLAAGLGAASAIAGCSSSDGAASTDGGAPSEAGDAIPPGDAVIAADAGADANVADAPSAATCVTPSARQSCAPPQGSALPICKLTLTGC